MSRFYTRRDLQPSNIFYWECKQDQDNALTVARTEGGGVLIAVCEERPVDSYNAMFELTATLSKDEAVGLRDFLIGLFPIPTP